MSEPRVALTFDAEHPSRRLCPPGTHDRILDALASDDVLATFFLQGRWASAYPDAAARIAREGHLVGNHSSYHAPMTWLSDQGIAEDVRDAERRIQAGAGVDPRPWFRCPFGRGEDDPRVISCLASLGYRSIGWNVDGADWDVSRDGASVEDDVVERVRSHGDGAVVVLHTWPEPTAKAVPGILSRLRREGFAFVTLGELTDEGEGGRER